MRGGVVKKKHIPPDPYCRVETHLGTMDCVVPESQNCLDFRLDKALLSYLQIVTALPTSQRFRSTLTSHSR